MQAAGSAASAAPSSKNCARTASRCAPWCAATTTRADRLRDLGAEVVVGDLTSPLDVANAMRGVTRMFFNMSVSSDYLEAAAVVAAVGHELGGLEVLVNMSQMTVSQMTLTSTEESRHQRWHWLAEHILTWSGVPVMHVRPTAFLDNPLVHRARGALGARAWGAGAAVRRRTHLTDRGHRRRSRRRRRCCANRRAGSGTCTS